MQVNYSGIFQIVKKLHPTPMKTFCRVPEVKFQSKCVPPDLHIQTEYAAQIEPDFLLTGPLKQWPDIQNLQNQFTYLAILVFMKPNG
jgi:hypothetical protein